MQKEGVHLGFAFNVPGGVMRMDIPWAVVRPEIDQMPARARTGFPWDAGWTYRTGSAASPGRRWTLRWWKSAASRPTNRIGAQSDPAVWLDKLKPSQTLYSWVMNNYWELCFKADQDGPDDVPLPLCCRTSSTIPWRRSGSASSAASRCWPRRHAGHA